MNDDQPVAPIMIGGHTIIARGDGLAWVEVEGEVVIYDDESGQLHLLDTTAALIWQLLDGETSLAQLAGEIGEALSHDRNAIEDDLINLTMDLLERSLVEVVSS